jgi:hypothetical protein
MNPFVWQFYQNKNDIEGIKDPFFEVLYLDEAKQYSWDELDRMAPFFPRSWYELNKLSREDRINFVKTTWKKILPFSPNINSFIDLFFSKIEDIGIFLIKDFPTSNYLVEMVYSLKDQKTFFRAHPPCLDEEIEQLNSKFHYLIPSDYLAFLKIHNGFTKASDTGLITQENLYSQTVRLHHQMERSLENLEIHHQIIDPKSLIPFYQCFGRDAYQCFYTEWYTKNGIGNVYYSLLENKISDISMGINDLAFNSFLDWLQFYLEEVDMESLE